MKFGDLAIIRGTSAGAVDWVKDLLILHQHQNREVICEQFKKLLEDSGDNVFFLLAIREHEEGEPTVEGFVVAYLNTDNQCYFPQCWVSKSCPSGTSSFLYYQVLLWAERKGCTKLLGELVGKGRVRAAQKRWGFEVLSTNIVVNLTDDYQKLVTDRLTKEIEHGKLIRKQQTTGGESKQSDVGSEGD